MPNRLLELAARRQAPARAVPARSVVGRYKTRESVPNSADAPWVPPVTRRAPEDKKNPEYSFRGLRRQRCTACCLGVERIWTNSSSKPSHQRGLDQRGLAQIRVEEPSMVQIRRRHITSREVGRAKGAGNAVTKRVKAAITDLIATSAGLNHAISDNLPMKYVFSRIATCLASGNSACPKRA